MGRKSIKKDRGYITKTEWQNEWGGFKDKGRAPYKRLPFFCCAISFTPFEDPACTVDGTVYDLSNIVPYIQKFHKHPVTGAELHLRDVIQLTFHKNAEGEYHDPVLNKVFTEHTHIVAIKTTGNVYAYEAIEQLNIKAKNLRDLLTDEPFTRKDIIQIQDPQNLQARETERFDHVKRDLHIEEEDETEVKGARLVAMSEDQKRMLARLNTAEASAAFEGGGGGKRAAALRALADAQLAAKANGKAAGKTAANASAAGAASAVGDAAADDKAASGPDPRLQPPDRDGNAPIFKPGASTWNTDDPKQAPPWVRAQMQREIASGRWRGQAKVNDGQGGTKQVPRAPLSAQYKEDAMHTTGAASRSFTSTAVNVTTANKRKMIRVERTPKAKAYLRLHTSLGDLNLELHCDIAPRACENFLVLLESGYYNNTIFHRSIRNFMIQGGDPTGTGTGGESIYGPTFKDELDHRALHSGRGVLSMANSGRDTNGSQFFVLYKSARHLDNKHTVFGRVVGGLEVLTAMERAQTDDNDKPVTDIVFKGGTVFVNPYKDEEEAERKLAEAERIKAEQQAGPLTKEEEVGTWFSNPSGEAAAASSSGVGKYLQAKQTGKLLSAPAGSNGTDPSQSAKKAKPAAYGNFDAW